MRAFWRPAGRRTSLSGRMKILVTLLCLSIVCLEAGQGWSDRQAAFRTAASSAENLARSLSQQADDTLEMADLDISGVIDSLAKNQHTPDFLARLSDSMASGIDAAPRIRGLFVYNASGDWIASSLRTLLDRANNSDRDYFVYHRTHEAGAILVSPPVRSRSGGQWVIPISKRIDNPDGSFGGVVVASIDVDYFARQYGRFDVGRKGSIALLGTNGLLYSRIPADQKLIGQDRSSDPLFRDHLPRSDSGAYSYVSPIDGVKRIAGYRRSARFPIVVVTGLAENDVLAGWWRQFLTRITIVGLLTLLLGVLGFRLATQVKRRQQAEAQLEYLATTDPLTEIANRRAFDRVLRKEWLRSAREGTSVSLMLLDVDQFKRFNDLYGHQAGDRCLRSIAAAISGVARRPADVPARYGGEELAIILPNTHAKGAANVAEAARAAVEALGLPHRGNEAFGIVTVSIGCATLFPPRGGAGMGEDALIAMADRALYRAKEEGRNRVVLNEPVSLVPNRASA
ncbi:diguanylate cyclase (GGDEF) domain-containing protein [Faunimonas pinastri]|uniref:diguanylate cyclase n=1 Tax=Faunimonas pinastri TaxID=1855383 RepID=A0A1H9CMM6_9HYPH|nr:GGDEF domain-containing protein [Faunimonas pinastri]SEQ02456.1 diguanylate cyclase (GGDEF) domain-containing protein [Faunimonas pinastri]